MMQVEMIEALIANLENTKTHLEELDVNDLNTQAMAICDHLIWCINQSDENLFSQRFVNEIKPHIVAAHQQRANTSSVIANLVNAIKVLPSPLNRTRPKAESVEIIKSLKRDVSALIDELNNKKVSYETDLETEKARLITLQEALTASQKVIDAQSARLDSLVEQAQSSFDEKRTEINEKNESFLANYKSELEDLLKTEKTGVSKIMENQKDRLGKREELADTHIKKLEELLGLAGDKALTKDYSIIAGEERGSEMMWSIGATVFFSLGLIFGAVVVWKFGLPPEMDIPALISRITIPFSALVPGFYCASKASGHRKSQIRLRNTGVRLATLEPFLSKFMENERSEIRKGLLDEFFKEKQETVDKRPVFGFSQKSLVEIIKTIKELK